MADQIGIASPRSRGRGFSGSVCADIEMKRRVGSNRGHRALIEYTSQHMSMRLGNARYLAMPGVSRARCSGETRADQVPEAM